MGLFVAAFIGFFILAILFEGLKQFRDTLYKKSLKNGCSGPRRGMCDFVSDPEHILQTLLHIIQVSVSYTLMLIIMSCNLWLFLAVVLGAACGYFLFCWRQMINIEDPNCCGR